MMPFPFQLWQTVQQMRTLTCGWVIIAGAALLSFPSLAQSLPRALTPSAPQAPAPPPALEDPLGRTTPHGTFSGFLYSTSKGDYKTAARFLDGRMSDADKEELARHLEFIIDRGLSVDVARISREPAGELGDDGKGRDETLLGTVHAEAGALPIYLDRVHRGNAPATWLFSVRTLKDVPRFAEAFEPSWLERTVEPLMPDFLLRITFLSFPLSRWFFALSFFVMAIGGAWLLARITVAGLVRFAPRVTRAYVSADEMAVTWPLRLIFLFTIIHIEARLAMTYVARQTLNHAAFILVVVGFVWLAMRAADAVADMATRRSQQEVLAGRIAVIHLGRAVTKAILVLAGLLVILAAEGVNLSAVVAGLGIGGIAIAFAAQKTIENLFGTVMIVADRPLRVGDVCKIGDAAGTIEEIGLRSTRVRTVEQTLITVPNGQLASMQLENITARGKILFRHTLGLTYGTTSEQVKTVLEGIHNMLRQNPIVESDSVRVRFLKFNSSSLDIEVFAFILTRDWPSFLAVQEELLLRCMQVVEVSGSSFALPSQTVYLANRSK
jgi:MscS family membrane protein